MEPKTEPQVTSVTIALLKQILYGTTYEFNVNAPTDFVNWWETTLWAQEMHGNLKKNIASRDGRYCNPKWTLNNRSAKQWEYYLQKSPNGSTEAPVQGFSTEEFQTELVKTVISDNLLFRIVE